MTAVTKNGNPIGYSKHLRRIAFVAITVMLIALGINLIFFFFFAEAYFPFDPGIGTHFPPAYTEAGFDQIQIGDSQERVLELIGEPLEAGQCLPEFCELIVWNYSEDKTSPDFAWLYRQVHFNSEGRVIEIVRDIMYD